MKISEKRREEEEVLGNLGHLSGTHKILLSAKIVIFGAKTLILALFGPFYGNNF